MGLFDAVVGALGQGNGGEGALVQVVAGMLHDGAPGGGLPALVQKFEQGGLGDLIGSWIGSGRNLPISADQLRGVLGSDAVAQIAQQLGLSHGDTAAQLAQVLPQVIDRLTPQGRMPAGGLGDLGGLLRGL